jgi:hypothetical protein
LFKRHGDYEKLMRDVEWEFGNKYTNSLTSSHSHYDPTTMYSLREIPIIIHTLAKLRSPLTSVYTHFDVTHGTSQLVQKSSPHSISLTLWGYAKQGIPCPNLCKSVNEHADFIIEHGNANTIVNTLWSLAVLEADGREFCNRLEHLGSCGADGGADGYDSNRYWFLTDTAQNIATLSWSLAKLKYPSRPIFEAIHSRYNVLTSYGDEREISDTLWAFGALGGANPVNPVHLFSYVSKHCSWFCSASKARDISNVTLAAAVFNNDDLCAKMFSEIEKRGDYILKWGLPQDVANICEACCLMGYSNVNFFAKILANWDVIVSKDISSKSLSTLVKSHSHFNYDTIKLFNNVDDLSHIIINGNNIQDISDTVLAYTEMDIVPELLLDNLASNVDQFISDDDRDYNVHHFINVSWCIVILGLTDKYKELLTQLWSVVVNAAPPPPPPPPPPPSNDYMIHESEVLDDGNYSGESLIKLLQIEKYASVHGVELQEIVGELRRRMDRAVETDGDDSGARDGRFADVYSGMLTDVGFVHERRAKVEGAEWLVIDMACRERMIAVEFAGKSTELSSGRENGRTRARRELLEKLGWTVVVVRWRDDVALGRVRADKRAWLKETLLKAGAVL